MDVRADLHIHTVLSPCADIEMLPPLIVQEALNRGIQLIAITDHNASANIESVQKAAQGTGLIVLPGMELQTQEEVHTLCIFDTLDQIVEFQKVIDRHLPLIKNDPVHFGMQLVVDFEGEVIREEEHLLLTSVLMSLEDAEAAVAEIGGIFIPAHIDRKAFGLIGVLGFVPPDLPIDAIEISRHIKPSDLKIRYPQVADYPVLQNGDVHRLDEFLGVTHFYIQQPLVSELRLAFQGFAGRSMVVLA